MPKGFDKQRLLIDVFLFSTALLLLIVVIGLIQKECMNIRAPKKMEIKDYRFGSSKARSCAIAVIGYRLETQLKDPKSVSLEFPGMLDPIAEIPDLSTLADHTLWRLATCSDDEFNVIFWYKSRLMERPGYLSVIRRWSKRKQSFRDDGFNAAIDLIGRDTVMFLDGKQSPKLSSASDVIMLQFLGWTNE